MGIFGRAIGGAAIGAFMSSGTGFDNMGMNAALGAGVGAFGGKAAGLAARKAGFGSLAAGARLGLQGVSRSMGKVATSLTTSALNTPNLSQMRARMVSSGVRGAAKMMDTANTASSFIGRNANTINKYGHAAFGAIGTAAAAHIGSSVLSSNRGYR